MAVRVQITAGGIYGAGGKEIAIGTELTLDAEPLCWPGRYIVLADTAGKEAVTNPKKA